jgi:hypothetical protein
MSGLFHAAIPRRPGRAGSETPAPPIARPTRDSRMVPLWDPDEPSGQPIRHGRYPARRSPLACLLLDSPGDPWRVLAGSAATADAARRRVPSPRICVKDRYADGPDSCLNWDPALSRGDWTGPESPLEGSWTGEGERAAAASPVRGSAGQRKRKARCLQTESPENKSLYRLAMDAWQDQDRCACEMDEIRASHGLGRSARRGAADPRGFIFLILV